MASLVLIDSWTKKKLLLHKRWPWHVLFWIGYVLFRFWLYYITVMYYNAIYLEYMLFSEIMFVAITYFTLWLYARFFEPRKYIIYFLIGAGGWIAYLYGRTFFQMDYLKNEPSFKGSTFINIFLGNITFVLVYFLFITACKYFKEGYIAQQFEAEKKQQQLSAEINNLKAQIAPHFLFNTLNNLYGLAVEKSDKLPDLMLRLSDLLRHSLYDTQRPLISLNEEMKILTSYIQLERIRMEDNLQLQMDNTVPEGSHHQIVPLILIVFIENAFKHAKFVKETAVNIYIQTGLDGNWFSLLIKNNYNRDKEQSGNGIGLANVKRRLELLYPTGQHELTINKEEVFYTSCLRLQLANKV